MPGCSRGRLAVTQQFNSKPQSVTRHQCSASESSSYSTRPAGEPPSIRGAGSQYICDMWRYQPTRRSKGGGRRGCFKELVTAPGSAGHNIGDTLDGVPGLLSNPDSTMRAQMAKDTGRIWCGGPGRHQPDLESQPDGREEGARGGGEREAAHQQWGRRRLWITIPLTTDPSTL